jgi:hypothetical protein
MSSNSLSTPLLIILLSFFACLSSCSQTAEANCYNPEATCEGASDSRPVQIVSIARDAVRRGLAAGCVNRLKLKN